MRVVVNQLAALGQKTGVGHYTSQLLRCLRTQAQPGEIDAFPEGWLRRVRETFTNVRPYLEGKTSRVSRTREGTGHDSWRSRALSLLRQAGRTLNAVQFRRTCKQKGYTLYHEPNFIPLPSDLPTVVTVHDLSVINHPEWHPLDRVRYFEKHFLNGLNRCTHFLAISEYARQELISTLNLPPHKVTCTYMGMRPGLTPRPREEVASVLKKLNLPSQYLLYLGTIEPRKNVLTLLRAYCALPANLRSEWPLLLVGSWGWNTGAVAGYYDEIARHSGVIHVGYIADEDIPALYSGARVLAYPSVYEGFGMPPLEMMACGGAVIAGTAGSVVETVGGKALLLSPRDIEGWRDALKRVITDDDWWQSFRKDAEATARPFNWEACAAKTLEVYRQIEGSEMHGARSDSQVWDRAA